MSDALRHRLCLFVYQKSKCLLLGIRLNYKYKHCCHGVSKRPYNSKTKTICHIHVMFLRCAFLICQTFLIAYDMNIFITSYQVDTWDVTQECAGDNKEGDRRRQLEEKWIKSTGSWEKNILMSLLKSLSNGYGGLLKKSRAKLNPTLLYGKVWRAST